MTRRALLGAVAAALPFAGDGTEPKCLPLLHRYRPEPPAAVRVNGGACRPQPRKVKT